MFKHITGSLVVACAMFVGCSQSNTPNGEQAQVQARSSFGQATTETDQRPSHAGALEDCAAAGRAHAAWVEKRIPTEAGKSLAAQQRDKIISLCEAGKWPQGLVACFDNAVSSADTDRCAENLEPAQKQAVSDLFTDILNGTRATQPFVVPAPLAAQP